jgi:hypothetical protein
MVDRMEKRKVTLSLPTHMVGAAQEAARRAGTDFSAFTARALRNETLRQQLAAAPPEPDAEWLDDIEGDQEATDAA